MARTSTGKVTLKQISDKTGYSLATVCNVINHRKEVNPATARIILDAANELGYVTSPGKIERIILVMYRKNGQILMETPLILSLIDGIEKEAQKRHVGTILYNIDQRDADYQTKLTYLLQQKRCGILLLATELSWEDMIVFEQLTVPFVVVDAWFREGKFSTVLMDNKETMEKAVEYLYSIGHREIGYIGSSIHIQNFGERKEGYTHAMKELGLPLEKKYQVDLHPTIAGAQTTMSKYLDTRPELPTAFVVVNDIVALGAIHALQDHGIRVPEDVSVIAFDNMPFGAVSSPPLTTFNVLKEEIGRCAATMLFLQSSGTNYPMKVTIPNTLVERASVRSLNTK